MPIPITISVVKARKAHVCSGCRQKIDAGDEYSRWSGPLDDGTPVTMPYHPDCRVWEEELYDPKIYNSDEWPLLHEHVAEGGREALIGAPASVIARFFPESTQSRLAHLIAPRAKQLRSP
jgi:hypothetical protein